MIFEPENSALARSQGPEEPVLDSCKFQGFVAKFSRYLPLSGGGGGPPSPFRLETRGQRRLGGVLENVMLLAHRNVTWPGLEGASSPSVLD